ncbi:MAG: MFS transporter [Anaerolineaceae bacterium]
MPATTEYSTPQQGGGAFASLRHRQFRWMYASNMAFFFAMNGQFVVRSYLAFKLTDSAFALGIVNLAVALPMLVISPFGGVIADRVEKKRLIMIGQALLLLNEVVVLMLLVTNQLEFWHLLVVMFLMGCLFPFIMPARQSIVANIVGRQGLPNAMALGMGGMNAARVVGPVTAGLVIAAFGLRWMYLVAVALYLVALLAISRVDRAYPVEGQEKKSVMGDLLDGVRYVRDDPPVRILLLLSLVPIMLAMPFQALLVVFAEDVWDVGTTGLGVLQAAAGVGGILGSVYVAWKGTTPKKLRLMMVSLLAFGGTLFLFALSPWFLLALPVVLISDVFASIFNTVNNTAIQVLIPDAVRGRVMSLMMMTFGLTPLGTVPISAAAQAWGAPVAVAGASALTIVIAVMIYLLSGALRSIDQTAAQALEDPGQIVKLEPRVATAAS